MPKIVDHEQYRRDLVSHCITLFAARGYAGLTTRAIAQALGVSTGTLYHYFPNKQAIFLAVADAVIALDETAGVEFAALSLTDRLPAMLRYVDAHRDRFLQHIMVVTEVLRLEDADGEVGDRIRSGMQQYLSGVALLLELSEPDRALIFLALVDGLLLLGRLDRPVQLIDHLPTFRVALYGDRP